jgi:lipid-binding SYLF domain-containing protein
MMTVILVFMQEAALKDFRASSGWEVGVDGSVALVTVGAGGSVDTTNIKDPVVGFVFG